MNLIHLFSLLIIANTFFLQALPINIIEIDIKTNWTLENANRSIEINNLTIPINVHHALEDNHLIDNPLYGYNDVKLRWIPYESQWTFRKYFEINQTLFSLISTDGVIVEFEFNSIDTIASIYLNDHFLLFAQNQFLKYTVQDFNTKLQLGMNKLEIQFKSPILYANELNQIYPYSVPPTCTPDVQNGECHVNFLRKQQCSFSWDWGPAFAPIGINDLITFKILNVFNYDFSLNTFQQMPYQLDDWYIGVTLNVTTSLPTLLLNLEISIAETNYNFKDQRYVYQYSRMIFYNLSIVLDQWGIELWYPNGYGKQSVYNLNINCTVGNVSIVRSRNLAFRSIQLIQMPVLDTVDQGLSFFFEINNIPIFLKGSNWIPMDVFQDRLNEPYLNWLMKSVVNANMNVLRVWGGGQYESDLFYDIADQLGIMIWQDFMFACATYPTNSEFLANVQHEVQFQLWRLSHHPSIIVWSGNNENEAAVATNWYGTNIDKPLYYNDYRQLYINVIRSKVLEIDPHQSRPFISSSPTNGLESEEENWLATNPYDLRFGDVHFYNYYIDGWNPESYPYSRFTSEFGFQSLPSYSTLATVYDVNTDMSLFSNMSLHRQHHSEGNDQLLYELLLHFDFPKNNTGLEFKKVIHLTQAAQAMSYKTAAEFHRRNREYFNKTSGLGYCMGFMYWQLNDIWQAPTWSTIEYGGKWKMAHYYIKKAYAPLIIIPNLNNEKKALEIYLHSDMLDQLQIKDAVELSVYKYVNGFEPLYQKNFTFTINSTETGIVASIDLIEFENKTNCSRTNLPENNCFFTFKFASKNPKLAEGENFLFYNQTFHQVNNVVNVNSIQKLDPNNFSIELQASQISLFVWLDLENADITGTFSDNGFHMTQPIMNITYTTINDGLDINFIRKYLNILSISLF